jgi:hypothetical protein
MENLEKDIALLGKIKKTEPSPYLLNKIQSRIEQSEEKTIRGVKLIPLAVIFILLIMVNIYTFNFESKNSNSKVTESHLSIYQSNQLYYD